MQYKVMKDYKKILEGVVNIVNTTEKSDIGFANICTYIGENCPELSESDNERIRKTLINFFDGWGDKVWDNGVRYSEVVAWLRKQGKHANFRNKIQIGDKVTRNDNGELVNLSQLERVAKKLEKQEEQKPVEEYNITGIGSKNAQGKLGEMIKNLKPVNEVLEQKPADKVEPKFKVGDWVVTSYGMVNQVIAVDEDGDGFTLDDDTYLSGSWKDNFHLWDITKDAKDGDVLVASDKSLFIYDGSINENGSVGFHIAFTEDMDIILNSDDGCGWEEKDSCHPATKEQRDLLFQKMKESGYEWDAEKKELKKIEQNPAWSEEDEAHFDSILKRLEGMCKPRATYTATRCSISEDKDWLKSLKERYTWKPSDEQMDAFSYYLKASIDTDGVFGTQLVKLYQDLKKL